MAPFMNESLPAEPTKQQGKQYDYSQFGSNGYEVPQDRCYRDPSNRKIRVLTIGAGISGILMAYQIQKQCENVEHVIYEKNENIGGMFTFIMLRMKNVLTVLSQVLGLRIDILVLAAIFQVMRIHTNLRSYVRLFSILKHCD